MKASVFVAVVALSLVACGTRHIVPTVMSQPGDELLTCDYLNKQIKVNTDAAHELLEKDKNVGVANVATSVIFGGLLAAALVDFSNEEQVKARSMIDRNERLTYLAKKRGCENHELERSKH